MRRMRYQIQGETLPVVICELEGGEKMITEGGAMSWMSPNMLMETTSNGGLGKAFGRAFSGEKMFQNIYTAQGGPGMIAFASSFPGSIKAFQIVPCPLIFCIIKPSPPNSPEPNFLRKCTESCTPASDARNAFFWKIISCPENHGRIPA